MKDSAISWCDNTMNFWEGCSKVSDGCKFCYAENRDKRFHSGIHWGPGAPRRRTSPHNWNEPIRWEREARISNEKRAAYKMPPIYPKVFSMSLGDWLDDEVDIAWLADMLRVIRVTPNLVWLLLTKRPQLWQSRLVMAKLQIQGAAGHDTHPDAIWILDWLTGKHVPKNVWVGASVENQEMGNMRVPPLLSIPAVVRFLSCEPLLTAVDLHQTDAGMGDSFYWHDHIHWVIVGGESGVGCRPMDISWARALRDQCIETKTSFFMKQLGGEKDKLHLLEHIPEDLRIREFPVPDV